MWTITVSIVGWFSWVNYYPVSENTAESCDVCIVSVEKIRHMNTKLGRTWNSHIFVIMGMCK